MGAALHDPSLMQDADEVGMADGRETMGYDERCAVFHQVLQRLLYEPFGFGVERRSSFIEDEDRRVLKDRPRYTESLALPAGETRTAVANNRVIPIGHVGDELMCIRDARSLFHSLLPRHAGRRRKRSIHTESDVIIDRVVEKDRLLANDAHEGAQVAGRKTADVHAIDGNSALRGVIEARNKIREGRLATAGLPDQSDHLAFRHFQTDIREHLALRDIRERDMIKSYHAVKSDRQR